MSDSDNDDWNFKLDDSEVKKTRRKEKVKPLLQSTQKKKIQVEASAQANRKSRRQLAREVSDDDRYEREESINPASHMKRFIAFALDLCVFAILIAAGQFCIVFFPEIGKDIESFLGPEIISSIPLDVGGLLVAVGLHLILVILPTASTQQSIGKRMMKLKIVGVQAPKVALGAIFIREYFAKPVALFTLIGVLMILFTNKRKGLHDFIAGTSVIDC